MRTVHRGGQRSSGFTLTEALVTSLVFSFFLAIVFVTMAWGFRTFSLAVARTDVSTEARRFGLFLETELLTSDYFSVTTHTRNEGADRRDGLCFVSRSDWGASDAYDPIEARPNWDRYYIYYATTEIPNGRFLRLSIAPSHRNEVGPFPYAPFFNAPSAFMLDDPATYGGGDLEHVKTLASSVKSFTAEKLPASQEVSLKVLLRQNSIMSRRGDGKREGATFELDFRIAPRNTL